MRFKSYADVENSLYSPEYFWSGMPPDGAGYPTFIKLDGANTSIWLGDDGTLRFGKRSCEITTAGDEFRGFKKWVVANQDRLLALFAAHPNWRLFGEWLVKHTINYPAEFYNRWYCFDVKEEADGEEEHSRWVPFLEYAPELKLFGLDQHMLTPVCYVHDYEEGEKLMLEWCKEKRPFGATPHEEGIVIKNYTYMNRFHGEHLKIKVVKEHNREKAPRTVKSKNPVDVQIAENLHAKYVTEEILEKNFQKLLDERDGEMPRMHQFGDFLRINNQDVVKDVRHDPADKLLYEENKDVTKAFGALMTNTARDWYVRRINQNG